jgi:hypothetical protein
MTSTELSKHTRQCHDVGSKDPPASASKPATTIPVTKFPCTSCDTKFPSLEALQYHTSIAHLHRYPCPSCYRIFSSSGALDEHQSTSHPSFSCSSCSQKFSELEALLTHGRLEHSSSSSDASNETVTSHHLSPFSSSHAAPEVQSCPMCKKSLSSIDELSYHMRTVHPLTITKKTYPCPLCDQTFSKKKKLSAHAITAHPEPPPPASHLCNFCDRSFKYPLSLDNHKAAKHQGATHKATKHPFTCGMCKFACTEERLLQEHITSAHPRPVSPPASYFCSFCDESFKLAISLDNHKVAKHPFTCGMCIFACMEERLLQEHVDLAHTCPVCHDSVFANGDLLNEHLAGHVTRPVSPPATYFCHCCDKSFKFSLSLDRHLAANHPFTCGMCEFACSEEELLREHIGSAHSCPVCHEGVFANGDLLNEHLVDHVTPYRCEVCQTRYAEEEDLLQHYKDSPDDIHPSCTKCDLGFQDEINYCNVMSSLSYFIYEYSHRIQHTETVHPQVSCQLCDGVLFDPEELPIHYFTSRNHPVCDVCQIGFSDQAEFAMVRKYYCHQHLDLGRHAARRNNTPRGLLPPMPVVVRVCRGVAKSYPTFRSPPEVYGL